MSKKVIVSPRNMLSDIIKGKTIEEALTSVTNNDIGAVKTMNTTNESNAVANFAKRFLGQPVMVYTVTFAFTGTLVEADGNMVVLEDTAWIAELGRLHETLHTVEFSEVEYVGIPMCINAASIIFTCALPSLPRKTK